MQRPFTSVELAAYDQPLPRYTSYPTAPEWKAFSSDDYTIALEELDQSDRPVSLYIHIPFCRTMCLYCGCFVILNRREEHEERYVRALLSEIDRVAGMMGTRKKVIQLHFGGGTPTKLTEGQLERILLHLQKRFIFDVDAEIAMEVDPRTVVEDDGRKLRFLHQAGWNRVSFGVQDLDPRVQEAVKRRQTEEMTRTTYELARKLGFVGINMDLIYGLPCQTQASFSKTIETIIELSPDRLALFSYAQVPWLKAHQKAIPEKSLPSSEEKWLLYTNARARLIEKGYVGLGMDHFAKEDDELARAYYAGTLRRNFQGYTVQSTSELIGLGITAIGSFSNGYYQNAKTLKEYYESLEAGVLPIQKGLILTKDDILRRDVIHTLMCQGVVDKKQIEERYQIVFDEYFAKECAMLEEFVLRGLVHPSDPLDPKICLSPQGYLLMRHVASVFDRYLQTGGTRRFSKAI